MIDGPNTVTVLYFARYLISQISPGWRSNSRKLIISIQNLLIHKIKSSHKWQTLAVRKKKKYTKLSTFTICLFEGKPMYTNLCQSLRHELKEGSHHCLLLIASRLLIRKQLIYCFFILLIQDVVVREVIGTDGETCCGHQGLPINTWWRKGGMYGLA